MTCAELRDSLSDGLRTENSQSLEQARHLGACAECSRLWAAHEELRTEFATVRESVPPVPASLDRAVLTNFRQYAVRSLVSSRRSAPALPVFRWAAAAAALLVLALGARLLFSVRERVPHRTGHISAQVRPLLRRDTNSKASVKSAVLPAAAEKPRPANRLRHRRDPVADRAESASLQVATPSVDFRSLMYCDPLSCADAMEVIRVQLPSPTLGLAPMAGRQSGTVNADVLVGADGVARGIRVVE